MTKPEAKDRRTAELEAEVAELKAGRAALEAEVAELGKQVRDLLTQLGRNSLTSSLPPSRDNAETRAKRNRKPKSRRSRRGQKGHKRSMCELVPPDQIDKVVELKAKRCEGSGELLCGHDPSSSAARRPASDAWTVTSPFAEISTRVSPSYVGFAFVSMHTMTDNKTTQPG